MIGLYLIFLLSSKNCFISSSLSFSEFYLYLNNFHYFSSCFPFFILLTLNLLYIINIIYKGLSNTVFRGHFGPTSAPHATTLNSHNHASSNVLGICVLTVVPVPSATHFHPNSTPSIARQDPYTLPNLYPSILQSPRPIC